MYRQSHQSRNSQASQRVSQPSVSRRRGALSRRAAALVAAVVAVLVVLPSAMAAAYIDPMPTYQPQTTCSPAAKKGTTMLAAYLQAHYQGSGSLGISRSCDSGGTSEHKEGRAFDWKLSVYSARDRGYADDFLKRITATDAAGNQDALARRMGIMYVIWNDHIYSSGYGYRSRAYKNAGCANIATCGDSLRHRNHMHISLTRAGGNAQTSCYLTRLGQPLPGAATAPAPAPKPASAPAPPATKPPTKPVSTTTQKPAAPSAGTSGSSLDISGGRITTLRVPTNGTAAATGAPLRAGTAYKLTVYGLYRYTNRSTAVSDAACTWSAAGGAFSATPTPDVARRRGSMDLLADGTAVFGSSCHGARHVYTATYRPRRTGPLSLKVSTRSRADDGSRLTVLVSAPATRVSSRIPAAPRLRGVPSTRTAPQEDAIGTLDDRVAVDTARATTRAATSSQSLTAGVTYQVTVTGVASLGDGVLTDGQCVSVGGTWAPQWSLSLARPDAEHGRLYLDGQRFEGKAPAEDTSGCASHQHTMTFTAPASGPAALALWDPLSAADDHGSLSALFQRVNPVTTPRPAASYAGTSRAFSTAYDRQYVASDDGGTVSSMMFRSGETYRLYASGTWQNGRQRADASCTVSSSAEVVDEGDTAWWTDQPGATGQYLGRLYVDGRPARWKPLDGRGVCDADHTYVADVTATKRGPVSLAMLDLDRRDNIGSVTVMLQRK